ncbi:MAG: hypothetical protein ABFD96_01400 [Armatimonadia bacterium]
MSSLQSKAWTWGYVIDGAVPGEVPFVGRSYCSLETAASYLGTPNVVYMNSNHDRATLTPQFLDHVAGCEQVVCGLEHGHYAEAARQVSQLSLTRPNITGGLIDDYLDFHGPSAKMTPEETREVYEGLKSQNDALRLYVVRYTWQDQADLLPYLPYFDVLNLWVWVANTYDWQVRLSAELEKIKQITGKPILLGLFLHDYGGSGGPMPMDVLEVQFQKAVAFARSGLIEGFVILQSGWLDREEHRPQAQWVQQYLQWAFGTTTTR